MITKHSWHCTCGLTRLVSDLITFSTLSGENPPLASLRERRNTPATYAQDGKNMGHWNTRDLQHHLDHLMHHSIVIFNCVCTEYPQNYKTLHTYLLVEHSSSGPLQFQQLTTHLHSHCHAPVRLRSKSLYLASNNKRLEVIVRLLSYNKRADTKGTPSTRKQYDSKDSSQPGEKSILAW